MGEAWGEAIITGLCKHLNCLYYLKVKSVSLNLLQEETTPADLPPSLPDGRKMTQHRIPQVTFGQVNTPRS